MMFGKEQDLSWPAIVEIAELVVGRTCEAKCLMSRVVLGVLVTNWLRP
jgi:hypothetical protein